MMTDLPDSLAGRLLIASPGLADPRFAGSVILVCAHSDDGAMGLVLNRVLPEIALPHLLGQLGIEPGEAVRRMPVHFGGPVEPQRG